MSSYTEPAVFIVALTGEPSGLSGVRAAGPFASFDTAQQFINECAMPEDDDAQLAVIRLEAPAEPSAFVIGE